MFKNCLIYIRNNVHVYYFVSKNIYIYILRYLKNIYYILCKFEKMIVFDEVFKKYLLKNVFGNNHF